MIKIELQFETGAEARQALTELFGNNITGIVKFEDFPIKDEKIAENFETPKTEEKAAETPTRKRQTKADKEAEKTSTTVVSGNEPEGTVTNHTDNAITQEQDNKAANAVTKEMLQAKAVELIRGGKKDQVTATIKSFDADSISQPDKKPVKVEDYAALMDAFNKI